MTWLLSHWLWLLCLLALTTAAVLSTLLARRQWHWPVAAVLWYGALSDVAREAIAAFVLRPERARLLALVGGDETKREAFSGAVRAWFHVERALHLGWMAAVCWMAVVVCSPQKFAAPGSRSPKRSGPAGAVGRSAGRVANDAEDEPPSDSMQQKEKGAPGRSPGLFVLAAWALVTFAVCRAYPALSGTPTALYDLRYVYAAAHVIAALTCGVCLARLYRRREKPVLRHLAVLALGCAELLVVGAGPVPWGMWTRWDLARVIYIAAAGVLCWRTGRALRGGGMREG